MNKDQFNILPNYINKKFEVSEVKQELKSVNIKSTDVPDLSIDTTISNDDWVIYLNGKYNYEYPSKKFWCKPQFVIRPQLPKTTFKYLFLTLSIPDVENNKITVKNRDELLFESSNVNQDIDIILKYKNEYTFNSLPFTPQNSEDKRVLGSYIASIKIVDDDNFTYPISFKNIITFDCNKIVPFIV